MYIKKKMLLSFSAAIFIVLGSWSVFQFAQKPQSEVKGVQTEVSPSKPLPTRVSTLVPSVVITPTITPKVIKRTVPVLSPTISSKQKGGWYWNAQLNKSQVWLGTDGEGKDIWSDVFPVPTATPTPFQTFNGGTNTVSTGSYSTDSTATTTTR